MSIYRTDRNAARMAAAPLVQPKVPAVDHYDLDDGDATHPIFIDYVPPAAAATFGKATLSWHLRAFRSTVSVNPSSVGVGTPHKHGLTVSGNAQNPAGVALGLDVGGNYTASNDGNTVTHAAGAYGPGTDNELTHTHPLVGTTAQAVTDGPVATITAMAIDGKDVTAALGGPWAGDVVEMDVTSVLPTQGGQWHTIQLTPSGLGRVVSMLRLYYA